MEIFIIFNGNTTMLGFKLCNVGQTYKSVCLVLPTFWEYTYLSCLSCLLSSFLSNVEPMAVIDNEALTTSGQAILFGELYLHSQVCLFSSCPIYCTVCIFLHICMLL